MNRFLRYAGKALLLIAISAATGFVCMLIIYSLPTGTIEENVRESVNIFQGERVYPRIQSFGSEVVLDNYTDSIMLLNAAYSGEESKVDKAINVYRINTSYNIPTIDLITYYSESEDLQVNTTSYSRYWHGYLLTLKPSLLIFNYGQIRILNTFGIFFAAVFLFFLMYKKGPRFCILPYIICLLMIAPSAIGKSLQYSTMYYVYTIAAAIILLKREWFRGAVDRTLFFFLIVGCVTSFFDFLTYPLLGYGIPMILYICSSKAEAERNLKIIFLTLISWLVGYLGMWSFKWLIGFAFGEHNLFLDAVASAMQRTSMADEDGASFTFFQVISKNMTFLKNTATAAGALFFFICSIKAIFLIRNKVKFDCRWVSIVVVAILPFIWYKILGNHSYVHSWFTYRELAVTAFALMSMVAGYACGAFSGLKEVKPKQKP